VRDMKRVKKALLRPLLSAAVVTAMAVSSLAQGAPPQGPPPVDKSKIEIKNRAPVSKEVLQVKLPKPVKYTLENGMRVLILEDHRFPTVTMQLQIAGADFIYQPADLPGLASVTADMLREGTKTRTSKQIAEQVDQLGASLSANSGSAVTINATGLTDNMEQWMPLMTDILLNPTFPAEELNKLKQRMLTQLKQQRTQPGFLANERFAKVVYADHPAAMVAATPESVAKFTPELLAQWHKERYVPQNAILGIAGDVDAKVLLPKLKAWFADWKRTELKEVPPPTPTVSTAKRVFLVDRPASVQTNLLLGNIGIDRRSPDYVAFRVMNRVLGDGPAARLFSNLREVHGYTYGAYSNFSALKYAGAWRANSEVRTEVTDGALTEFFNEIRRIGQEPVPADELEQSKRSVVAAFALSLEQPTELLSYALQGEIYGLPADYWDTFPAKIMAVNAAEVQRVAQKYLKPDTVQVIAVGDGAKIKTVLEKYGPLQVFGTDGKAAAKVEVGK
jgi:zinc protease